MQFRLRQDAFGASIRTQNHQHSFYIARRWRDRQIITIYAVTGVKNYFLYVLTVGAKKEKDNSKQD